MRKQKKKNYIKYKKIFESWNKNRSILRDAKCNYTYIPDEEFRQCYVPVTEKNSISFYKVRHALPRYWYISDKGTMITTYRGKVELYIGQPTSDGRLQARFTYNGEYALQREAIVAIVFEEKIRIDSEVRKLIIDNGIKAFRKKGNTDKQRVELHHVNGHLKPPQELIQNEEEILKLMSENCKFNAITFIRADYHKILTSTSAEMHKRLLTGQLIPKDIVKSSISENVTIRELNDNPQGGRLYQASSLLMSERGLQDYCAILKEVYALGYVLF